MNISSHRLILFSYIIIRIYFILDINDNFTYISLSILDENTHISDHDDFKNMNVLKLILFKPGDNNSTYRQQYERFEVCFIQTWRQQFHVTCKDASLLCVLSHIYISFFNMIIRKYLHSKKKVKKWIYISLIWPKTLNFRLVMST